MTLFRFYKLKQWFGIKITFFMQFLFKKNKQKKGFKTDQPLIRAMLRIHANNNY